MTRFKAVFHIGMGKTGTSSIQNALLSSEETLAEAGASYLGMWPAFVGTDVPEGMRLEKLIGAKEADMTKFAQNYIQMCREIQRQSGNHTFIFSNESIFEFSKPLRPFFEVVGRHADLQLIAYIRAPESWLPSAYSQWALKHKTFPGPIRPINEVAETHLIRQYKGVYGWCEHFPEKICLRNFDAAKDVVDDFFGLLNIKRDDVGTEQLNSREERAHLLLRALFNNRYEAVTGPEVFDERFIQNQGANSKIKSLEDFCSLIFNSNLVEDVTLKEAELFSFINSKLDIKFIKPKTVISEYDVNELRNRLLEYLIDIVFNQSDRLDLLEKRVAAIEVNSPK